MPDQEQASLGEEQYEAPLGPLLPCEDCDRHMRECACDDVLRCSCLLPDVVCVCRGPEMYA